MAGLLDPAAPSGADNSQADDQKDLLGNVKGAQEEPLEMREWMKELDEPLQKSKTLSKFKDWKDLAKSYVELEKRSGRSVAIPGKDSPQEEWEKFFERVGRPKSPDDYAIDRGKVSDEDFVKAFKSKAHQAGLNEAQANELFKHFTGYQESKAQADVEQFTARMKEADRLLRREWGPHYDSRITYAKQAYTEIFDEDIRNDIADSGLANNPRFIKVLADLGEQLKGDGFRKGAGLDQKPANTLAWMDKKYGNGA